MTSGERRTSEGVVEDAVEQIGDGAVAQARASEAIVAATTRTSK
jgi:hypothetical protein